MFGQVILTLSLTPFVYYPYKPPKNPSKLITILLKKKSSESLAKKIDSPFLAQVQSKKLYYPSPNPNPFSTTTTTLSLSFCSYHHLHYCSSHHLHYCSSSQAMACSTCSLKKLTNVPSICSHRLTSSLFYQRSRWLFTPYARACFLPLVKNALSCL